jgi:hypothetical protein
LCLAVAPFFQYPVKTAHKIFTIIKFGMLLATEVRVLCRINKKVLGRRTPKASMSSLTFVTRSSLVGGQGRHFVSNLAQCFCYHRPPLHFSDTVLVDFRLVNST